MLNPSLPFPMEDAMWLFSSLKRWWFSRLSDEEAVKRYHRAGRIFGDAVSMLYMGECIGFAKLHADWEFWEKECARRGFRTFSVDAFTDLGGWGRPIEDFGSRLKPDEQAVLHAERYREMFLGKIRPAINFAVMCQDGQPQCGVYALPSTEDPKPIPPPYRSAGGD